MHLCDVKYTTVGNFPPHSLEDTNHKTYGTHKEQCHPEQCHLDPVGLVLK